MALYTPKSRVSSRTNRVSIRLNGDVNHWYFIKLGPMDEPSPPELTSRGGDVVDVALFERERRTEVVNLTFPDGVAAYAVPREFIIIMMLLL
jgi:hypothetical protein